MKQFIIIYTQALILLLYIACYVILLPDIAQLNTFLMFPPNAPTRRSETQLKVTENVKLNSWF